MESHNKNLKRPLVIPDDKSKITSKTKEKVEFVKLVRKSSTSSKNNLNEATRMNAANNTENISGIFEDGQAASGGSDAHLQISRERFRFESIF